MLEAKINTWVDKKMVISVALGILLAAWVLWIGAFVMRAVGIGGHYGMKGGMMRGDMHKKMMMDKDMMQEMKMDGMMDDMGGASGTFMEGTEIPTDIDTSAM
jgi:hypothetical protein